MFSRFSGYSRQITGAISFLAGIHLVTSSSAGQVYPSADVALVIPGGYVVPTDPQTLVRFPTPESVRLWEQQHADLVVGGNIGPIEVNPGPYLLGYMYNQKLEFNPTPLEMSLRQQAEVSGVDYESLFLHFAEDTWLRVEDPDDGSLTPFGGFPYAAGWTTQPDHAGFLLYQSPPYDKPVWQHHGSDGGLYVYLFEKFDRLHLSLSARASSGQLVVEYPSAVDARGQVTRWSPLTVVDSTDNLARDGEIRWTPPVGWKRVRTHDGSGKTYGGGPYFGKTLVRDGGRFYVVRLMWRNDSGEPPRLADIRLKNWLPVVTGSLQDSVSSGTGEAADKGQLSAIDRRSDTTTDQAGAKSAAARDVIRLIPGWDPDNDINGDGYVDEREFNNLANPHARARFQYEARVVPLGRMWSPRSSWCRPNLFAPALADFLAEYYGSHWQQQQQAGAYNDDFYKLLNGEFDIVSGGQLLEYNGPVNGSGVEAAYRQAFASQLAHIQNRTKRYIGANISMLNPFEKATGIREFLPAFSIFLREGYIRPSLGLSGWFGLNRTWDTFTLAAMVRWSVLMAMVNHGSRVHRLGNTPAHWQKDIESTLAQYYLLNVPGQTFYHIWNQWFDYGSGNTSSANFHTEGIPRNVAYQPAGLLSIDIGTPSPHFPEGREPMAYMAKTGTSDYAVIGHSNSTELLDTVHNGQTMAVLPSNIYYLYRSAAEVVPQGPAEVILARHYTRGLVLYRTDFFGHGATFHHVPSITVELPGLYRRVLYDGSLSEPVSSISLSGYEGVILQTAYTPITPKHPL